MLYIPWMQNLVKVSTECGTSHNIQNTERTIQKYYKYFKYNNKCYIKFIRNG